MTNEQLTCATMYLNELLGYGESGKDLYYGAASMLETLGVRIEVIDGEHVLLEDSKPSI